MSTEALAKADCFGVLPDFLQPAYAKASAGVRNASALRAGVSNGAVAQLGERLLCKQEVTGSIPVGSTKSRPSKDPPAFGRWRLHHELTPNSI